MLKYYSNLRLEYSVFSKYFFQKFCHETKLFIRFKRTPNTTKADAVKSNEGDFKTFDGGKDHLLGPYLLENGYVKVLWGRQNVFLKI